MASFPYPIDMLDKDVQSAIKSAEKKDGYQYGARVRMGQDGKFEQVFIGVAFYPKRKWYLHLSDGTKIGLTKEIFDTTSTLKI